MASAFWGGFAGALGQRMDARFQQDMDLQKQERLLELSKKYEDELIDPSQTQIVGNEEIKYNKRGKEISRRTLSPEELEARSLAKRKATADVSSAEAGAQKAGLEAQYYTADREHQIGMDKDASARGWAAIGLDRERLDRDKPSNQISAGIDEVVMLLQEGGGENTTSPEALTQQFEIELQQAAPQGEAAQRRVIAKYKGLALRLKSRSGLQMRQEFGTDKESPIEALLRMRGGTPPQQ